MVEHRTLRLDGREYTVTISDEREALSAAAAAGRAIVGVINKELPDQDLSPCAYAVERAEDIDEEFLLGVLRRRLGLPWVIARTKRLTIREFTASDPLCAEPVDGENGRVFMDRELLAAYIGSQYRVFGYGIWALEETATGEIVGKAGLSDRGLGYHIYAPHRRKGYACEACRAIRAMDRKDARTVPIIAVTANAFAEDVARTTQAGMDGHISKPIDFEQLKELLKQKLTQRTD